MTTVTLHDIEQIMQKIENLGLQILEARQAIISYQDKVRKALLEPEDSP